MSEPALVERWRSAAWQAEAAAWVDDGLAAAGTTRAGPLELVRLRPWGTVLRAPSADGRVVFFKATAPATAFEAGLYALLTRVTPDRVLHPLALDPDAGWLLLPDGGAVLSEQHEGGAMVDHLADVAARYAELQLALVPHLDELLALGVADMRPAAMAARFDEALEVARACLAADGAPDRGSALARVVELRATFTAWCDRLAAAPGAATLDHNDLHGGNVFVDDDGHGARFFDWGDAVVSHPFASALVLRSVIRWTLGVDDETPAERRILDAYLEPFGDLAPRTELREVVEVACEVGKVARALVWARAVASLPPDEPDPDGFRTAPVDWLLELLEGPLASAAGR